MPRSRLVRMVLNSFLQFGPSVEFAAFGRLLPSPSARTLSPFSRRLTSTATTRPHFDAQRLIDEAGELQQLQAPLYTFLKAKQGELFGSQINTAGQWVGSAAAGLVSGWEATSSGTLPSSWWHGALRNVCFFMDKRPLLN